MRLAVKRVLVLNDPLAIDVYRFTAMDLSDCRTTKMYSSANSKYCKKYYYVIFHFSLQYSMILITISSDEKTTGMTTKTTSAATIPFS